MFRVAIMAVVILGSIQGGIAAVDSVSGTQFDRSAQIEQFTE